jgi:hypothetical protein
MRCNGLIDPTQLAIDMLLDTQREPARYVAGVPAPFVITLNGVAAMEALNYFLLAIAGLHTDEAPISSVVHLPRDRDAPFKTIGRIPIAGGVLRPENSRSDPRRRCHRSACRESQNVIEMPSWCRLGLLGDVESRQQVTYK